MPDASTFVTHDTYAPLEDFRLLVVAGVVVDEPRPGVTSTGSDFCSLKIRSLTGRFRGQHGRDVEYWRATAFDKVARRIVGAVPKGAHVLLLATPYKARLNRDGKVEERLALRVEHLAALVDSRLQDVIIKPIERVWEMPEVDFEEA